MNKSVWEIKGYDGIEEFFSDEVPGNLSEDEMRMLLQRLAARHLSEREIVGASMRKNSPRHNSLLEVKRDRSIFTAGQNPHYIAFFKQA